MQTIRRNRAKLPAHSLIASLLLAWACGPAFGAKDDFETATTSNYNATTETTTSSANRAASIRANDIESATELLLQGKWLYERDVTKLGGYQYCGQSVALANRGELRRSIREASKALYLGKRGHDRKMRGYAYRDLAYAYSLAGNLYWAEDYAEKAIKDSLGDRKVKGPANKVLGDVALRQDRPKDALKFYKRALSLLGDRNGTITASMANAYLAMGEIDKAQELFNKAVQEGGGLLANKGLADAALAAGRFNDAEALYAKSLTFGGGKYHEMWAYAGVGKARQAQGDKNGAIESYLKAIELAGVLRAQFRSEEFKTGFFSDTQTIFNETIDLLMAANRSDEAFDVSERSRARALLDMIRNRVIASQGIDAFADAQTNTVSTAELRKILPTNSAIVSFHVTEKAIYSWVVRNDGASATNLDAAADNVSQLSLQFRESVRLRNASVQDQAKELFDKLIRPLSFRTGESIVFVPHGPLHYVPFQALHDGNSYLIESHAMQYAPSASVYSSLLKRKASKTLRLLALGNPSAASSNLLNLPGAEQEVQQIGKLFSDSTVLVRDEATKDRLFQAAPTSQIVHVAAHVSTPE